MSFSNYICLIDILELHNKPKFAPLTPKNKKALKLVQNNNVPPVHFNRCDL